jgi:hypothetical protein
MASMRSRARAAVVLSLCAGWSFFGPAALADPPAYKPIDLYTMNPPDGLTFPSVSSFNATSAGAVVGFGTVTPGKSQAILWSADGAVHNLNPTNLAGFDVSIARAVAGGQQVGYGGGPATGLNSTNSNYHALLWRGTADSALDLHPTNLAGFNDSGAFGTNGVNQVGYGTASADAKQHALLWGGSANSAVDLQPTKFTGYFASDAYGVSGDQQVGVMSGRTGNVPTPPHAVLWTGSADSAVDLQPTNLRDFNVGTAAYGIGGGQQVGYGSYSAGNSITDALLWNGTADSAVDLSPAGSTLTIAYATNGRQQAGYMGVIQNSFTIPHAMVWQGTAASAFDLQTTLASNFRSSTAYSVSPAGDVFGVAGDGSGNYHAMEWVAPPHSASATVHGGPAQTVTAAGRSPDAGDVRVTFPSASGGTFTNVNSLTTAGDLAARTAPVNFALPGEGGLTLAWDLAFDGTFTAPATLVFHYDPGVLGPGVNESDLRIEHYHDGQWETLAGAVDPSADTITVTTDTFSPFALGAVPEPSCLAIIGVAASGLLVRRRRTAR